METISTENKIYEIAKDFEAQVEEATAGGADAEEIAAVFNFCSENLKEQMLKGYHVRENYAYQADVIDGEAKALEERLKALKERSKKYRARADAIDNALALGMAKLGETSIHYPEVDLSVELKEKIEIDDPEAVPDELRNTPKIPEPSKTKIKKYLQEHPECDFAHMEKVLEIKFK